MRHRVVAGLVLGLGATISQAALHGRMPATPGGTDYQAYYDDLLNITWVADGNLAVTHSFGVPVNGDRGPGTMSWDTAQQWIAAMNAAGYLGVSDWRQPRVIDTDGADPDSLGDDGCDLAYSGTDCGWNVDPATGEISHLYYVTLGNIGGYDPDGVHQDCDTGMPAPPACLTNVGPLTNFLPNHYWTGTSLVPDDTLAWEFNARIGSQNVQNKPRNSYVWAVRNGDIALTVSVQAVTDTATTAFNTPVVIAIAHNDIGLVDPVTIGIASNAANGTLTVNGSPGSQGLVNVTYTPDSDFFGADSFVYSVASSNGSDEGIVNVEVRSPDADGDGLPDQGDNCTLQVNPTQLDADGDGYGNRCDADLNNSGLVTTADFAILRSVLNQSSESGPVAAAADINGSGLVTAADLALLRAMLNAAPGPSGVVP